ncbi:MAG: hypothetical protein KJO80_09980 [Gammaproteobacteria bacterium]|nr:hypothetical protein [Gammaproteobacteria bacterium]
MNWQKGTPQMGEHRGSAKMMELEARIKELEAQLKKIESVLDIDSGGTTVVLKSKSKLKITAPAVEIEGQSFTEVKGGLIKLNGGTKPVARLGDTVAGGPGTGSIVTGSPSVMVS